MGSSRIRHESALGLRAPATGKLERRRPRTPPKRNRQRKKEHRSVLFLCSNFLKSTESRLKRKLVM